MGTAPPVVDLPRVGGDRLRPDARPAVIAFVSTACGSCARTADELVRLAGRGVAVAAIAQPDASDADLASFDRDALAGSVPLARDDGATGRAYRISAFPTVYVVGADGRIADAWVGEQPPERFDAALTPPA